MAPEIVKLSQIVYWGLDLLESARFTNVLLHPNIILKIKNLHKYVVSFFSVSVRKFSLVVEGRKNSAN